jgi:hypothetical protein
MGLEILMDSSFGQILIETQLVIWKGFQVKPLTWMQSIGY